MRETYRRQFVELLNEGAAVQDIFDSPVGLGYAVTHRPQRFPGHIGVWPAQYVGCFEICNNRARS